MGQVLNPLRTEVHTYKPLPQHLFSCEVTPSFPKPGQLVGTVKVLCHGCSWKLLSHSIPWWLITRMMKSSSLLHHPSAQGWWNHLHNSLSKLHKSRVAETGKFRVIKTFTEVGPLQRLNPPDQRLWMWVDIRELITLSQLLIILCFS